jgi:hypothetical protein
MLIIPVAKDSVDTLPLPLKKANFSKATRRQVEIFLLLLKITYKHI